jgi:small subunit ribosomal protein S4e
MASKGENKKQKSISAPKARYFPRKKKVWTITSKPGPFTKKTSVPLGFVLRELAGIAHTMKEAKVALNQGAVKVNGKIVKSHQFSVGLFDIVEIENAGKKYRVVYDSHSRFVLNEMDAKEKLEKISRVVGKRKSKGGKICLNTAEGFVFMEEKTDIGVGDSVRISLPAKKIVSHISMKKGNIAYVIGGTHIGEIAAVEEITPGTAHRPELVELKKGDVSFKTLGKYVFMVGEKEPLIKI